MFPKSEECHTPQGIMFKIIIYLTFSSAISMHACLNSQVSERLEMFGKGLEETGIAMWEVIPHTLLKRDVIYEVKSIKRSKRCPNFSV